MQTGDSTLVKQLNKGIVLNLIRRSSPIARSVIARVTGLNKSTVSSLTAELVADQEVLEVGSGRSSGGRRPQLLSFNARAGLVVGLEIGVTFLRGVLCDLLGRPVATAQIPFPADSGVDAVVADLTGLARGLIDQAPPTPLGVLGAGVGVPGTVDISQGTVLLAPNLGWRDVPLRSLLETRLGLLVFLENEANAAAMGEKWFGVGTRAGNFIYVSLGIGVGAGIILNGQLYRGSRGIAGEVGHMTVDANGPACGCGNRGCWELYASERALRRLVPGNEQSTLSALLAQADHGDTRVISALHAVGESLGAGLVSLMNAFDPELVVLGGPLARAGKWLINPAEQALRAQVMPGPGPAVPMVFSALALDACALGAASILVEQRFSLPVSG